MAIDQPDSSASLVERTPLAVHSLHDLFSNAGGSRTGAQDDHALLAQRRVRQIYSSQEARQRDCSRTLDVIVEGAHLIAVVVEQTTSIAFGEILPLQERIGELAFGS